MAHQPTEDDVGQTVVDADGDEIGVVDEVTEDGVYVKLGEGIEVTWGESGADRYPVGADDIEAVTDSEVRLVGQLS
jgi:hypothetical protein